MTIYLVAFFKFYENKPECGFERVDLQTFYSTLQKAQIKACANFDDEAGYYKGIIIEEKEEGNPFYTGIKQFYILDDKKELVSMKIPDYMKNWTNII